MQMGNILTLGKTNFKILHIVFNMRCESSSTLVTFDYADMPAIPDIYLDSSLSQLCAFVHQDEYVIKKSIRHCFNI